MYSLLPISKKISSHKRLFFRCIIFFFFFFGGGGGGGGGEFLSMVMWYKKGASHSGAFKERENSIQEFQQLPSARKSR